jgi:hypothetical protein
MKNVKILLLSVLEKIAIYKLKVINFFFKEIRSPEQFVVKQLLQMSDEQVLQ